MKAAAILLGLLVTLSMASASLSQSATGGAVHYQVDGGGHGDAPDICADADPEFQLHNGTARGNLVAGDDETDVYEVEVGADRLGIRHTISVLPEPASGHDVHIAFQMPGCSGGIELPKHHPIALLVPPLPAPGEKTITATHEASSCSDRWHIVLNQLDQDHATPTLHVIWSNGERLDLAPTKAYNGAAHYEILAHNGFSILSVSAQVPAAWSGNFNIGPRVCDLVDGDVRGAIVRDRSIDFTPVVAGTYTVEIRYVPMEPPTSIPLSCHVACAPILSAAQHDTAYQVDFAKA